VSRWIDYKRKKGIKNKESNFAIMKEGDSVQLTQDFITVFGSTYPAGYIGTVWQLQDGKVTLQESKVIEIPAHLLQVVKKPECKRRKK